MFTQLQKEIIKNGGATLDKNFKQTTIKKGFMVSIQGYEYITKDIIQAIKKGLEYKEIIKDKKGYYVGFWIDTKDNNKIYVDISKNIDKKRDAINTAKKNLQKGIYDIKNYKFIKQYDTTHDIPSNYRNDTNNYKIFSDIINIVEL